MLDAMLSSREKSTKPRSTKLDRSDGYRIQTHLNRSRVTIYSRNGHDSTKRLHSIARCFDLPIGNAIFDGELVVTADSVAIFSDCET
jgi:ATP-dependent DNA ligase